MTPLVQRALSDAGLLAAFEARASDDRNALDRFRDTLEKADWLLLGAIADELRARELGPDVRIFANVAPPMDASCIDLMGTAEEGGIPFLRRVALARIFSERGASVRVGWDGLGLEFAQVTLAFGANELVGAIRFKDGELVAVDALLGHGKRSRLEPAQNVKRREIARFLARAGRQALFANTDGTFEPFTGELAQTDVHAEPRREATAL